MLAGYLVVCVVGLALLARSSDALVVGSSALAARLGVPTLVIGLVVIGFGTSTPELLVSGLAAASGSPAIGVGTVIGSNIANLSLILGAAALVAPVAVRAEVVRREAPLALLASLAFALALQNGLTRIDGVLLLLLMAACLALLLHWASGDRTLPAQRSQELGEDVAELVAADAGRSLSRVGVQAAAGLLGTLLGAQALVWASVGMARAAGLSEGFVGATIVAVGTSLPELITSAQAARRGEPDLIVGNLLGSNLFNALAVGGVVAVIDGGTAVGPGLRVTGCLVMLAVSALAMLFMRRRFRVIRWEAATLIAVYVATLPLLGGA
ncbi:MAG TPA: calcium/sodium antiporter [Kineosporiaceae bacterium]|nr:calcium/sodium antiporter [Kineosporiaceae bacterium]